MCFVSIEHSNKWLRPVWNCRVRTDSHCESCAGTFCETKKNSRFCWRDNFKPDWGMFDQHRRRWRRVEAFHLVRRYRAKSLWSTEMPSVFRERSHRLFQVEVRERWRINNIIKLGKKEEEEKKLLSSQRQHSSNGPRLETTKGCQNIHIYCQNLDKLGDAVIPHKTCSAASWNRSQ